MKNNTASPWSMPWTEWKDVLVRAYKEASDDNVGLIAAGVAFYAFLAMVPLLGAIVLSYGLVAEPATVMRNIGQLTAVMPADAAKLVGEQLLNVVQTSGSKKGLGLLLALGVALFGARQGAGAIVTALNIAYEEKEKRGFISLNLLALAMTAASVLVAILATVAIGALGHLESLLPGLPGWAHAIGKLMSYALLAAAAAAGAASLYRWGPSRDRAKWVWLTPGSLLTALLWLLLTVGFGIYVSRFGNYNATYGSLATVVVLLTWLYLSAYVLLFGAELNSELEHQTTADTTVGGDKPMGERGAWSADHVAGGAEGGPEASHADAATKGSRRKVGAVPTGNGGSNKLWLAGAGVVGLWLGRKIGVRKGKRLAAKKAARRVASPRA
jgi:membrane protein